MSECTEAPNHKPYQWLQIQSQNRRWGLWIWHCVDCSGSKYMKGSWWPHSPLSSNHTDLTNTMESLIPILTNQTAFFLQNPISRQINLSPSLKRKLGRVCTYQRVGWVGSGMGVGVGVGGGMGVGVGVGGRMGGPWGYTLRTIAMWTLGHSVPCWGTSSLAKDMEILSSTL